MWALRTNPGWRGHPRTTARRKAVVRARNRRSKGTLRPACDLPTPINAAIMQRYQMDIDAVRRTERRAAQEQQELIRQHQQRVPQYREALGQQQRAAQERAAQLRQQKRNAQYRFQQEYLARLRQQQSNVQGRERYDHDRQAVTTATKKVSGRTGRSRRPLAVQLRGLLCVSGMPTTATSGSMSSATTTTITSARASVGLRRRLRPPLQVRQGLQRQGGHSCGRAGRDHYLRVDSLETK